MPDITTLKPLQRAALRAGLAATGHGFHRTRGGYLPITGERTVFTTRTIRAMERDGLIAYRDQFAETAVLTDEGIAAAKALREAGDAGRARYIVTSGRIDAIASDRRWSVVKTPAAL